MRLKKVGSVEVVPTTPFAFDSTFHKPDHFTTGDNHWEKGIKWQTFNFQGKLIGVVFRNTGTINRPRVNVALHCNKTISKTFQKQFIDELIYCYNMNLDLAGFNKRFEIDKTLGPIIDKWKGMRPGHPSSLYEYLIIGILLQNATVKRSVQMHKALLDKYGTKLEYDGKELLCFWDEGGLSKVTEDDLRELKVGYRAKSIKKIDESFANGLINEIDLRSKDLETQKEKLLSLYGVGPATVWYLLFDVFHHWNYFNHISPWEQKIYSKLFFDKDPDKPVPVDKILKYLERHRPYKHLAVHYIWEDLWWKRKNKNIPWLEKLIRM